MLKHRSYNFFGNLAIVNFDDKISVKNKKLFALNLMKKNPAIKTVLEKSGHFKGRLRKMKTNYISGLKTKEVIYNENGCTFRFDVDETYFSPRLSNERKEVSSYIKRGENVLVMFAGVSPFPIIIAKNTKAKRIYSNELNKKANKYAELNIKLNHVENKVELVPGDIKKVAEKIFKGKLNVKGNLVPLQFDVIVMPRPQLKDSFLKQAFMLSKKGTRIYYYDFCKIDEISKIVDKIKNEAVKYRKKIKIIKTKNAGDLAPYKIRCRVDFKVLN